MYFQNYLTTLPEAERTAITQQLPNLLDWFIQAGSQAMTATAGTERAFMLGGSGGNDTRFSVVDDERAWRFAA